MDMGEGKCGEDKDSSFDDWMEDNREEEHK